MPVGATVYPAWRVHKMILFPTALKIETKAIWFFGAANTLHVLNRPRHTIDGADQF